ncbi:amidase [Peristeroidobacter soli]|uniref:amidase n=1 Tax=Peristeroidobacter soli TaxID=2497877 RepID=UPI00101D71F6|nr:amidase [Peristeroidobacter soli]
MKRRDLFVGGVLAAAVAPLAAIGAEPASDSGVTLPAQARTVAALRDLDLPRSLQPAVHFDPRLPGVEYPPQTNSLQLAARRIPKLPASDTDIAFAPVTDQSHWLRTGQISSRRLTEIYLARIARLEPKLHYYITVTADLARAQATAMDAELEQGKIRGPLHGVPYSLKDTFDTKGIATTWGCALFRDRVPTEDAAVTRMLQEAGAVLLGKVAMGELANGWEWFGGECMNPWNLEEPAGGSSSGSGAATAAGLCSFSIGTDNLGSVLNPADRCGIVGLRPTFGRVPVRGAMPLTPSLERIGPLCRSVEDAALVLAAINGRDPSSACSIDMGFSYDAAIDPSKLRIGYSEAWFGQVGFEKTQEKVAATAELAALQALKDIGVTLVPVELPKLPYMALLENLYVESAAVFDDLGLSGRDAQLVNRVGWPANWRKARQLSAVDYLQLERFRRLVMQHIHSLYSDVDMVFGPTYGSFEFFAIMNFTGHPGLTLRAGFAQSPSRARSIENFFAPADSKGSRHTITRNVTFHGRLFEEGRMIALARILEARLGVQARRPPVG